MLPDTETSDPPLRTLTLPPVLCAARPAMKSTFPLLPS